MITDILASAAVLRDPPPVPVYDQDGITIYHGDARRILTRLPADTVDAVITDPPFGISKKGGNITRSNGYTLVQEFFDEDLDWDASIKLAQTACYYTSALLKARSNSYWFVGHRQFGPVMHVLEAHYDGVTGFNVWRKSNAPPSVRKASWRYVAELCAWGGRPKHFISQQEMRNVLEGPAMMHGQPKSGHPTEKPLWLIERILLAATDPGDLVLDPFMGSGTVAVACKKHGRRFVGIELREEWVRAAIGRLQQGVLQLW